ncbi:MAG: hypothetical protein WC290_01035 [archaeon]
MNTTNEEPSQSKSQGVLEVLYVNQKLFSFFYDSQKAISFLMCYKISKSNITRDRKLNQFCFNKKRFNNFNQKGIIFSTDATISFVIILFTILIFTLNLSNTINLTERELTQLELDQKAIFITDSLIKNQNTVQPLLGACIYDEEKKRVLTNNIDYLKIKQSSGLKINTFFVESITIEFLKTKQIEKVIYNTQNTTQCTSIKRFIIANNQKAIIEVRICKEN